MALAIVRDKIIFYCYLFYKIDETTSNFSIRALRVPYTMVECPSWNLGRVFTTKSFESKHFGVLLYIL